MADFNLNPISDRLVRLQIASPVPGRIRQFAGSRCRTMMLRSRVEQ